MYYDYNEIITVEELAEILRIGMNTAYKLVNSGEIESFKIMNKHRIQRSAVIDYIINKSKRKYAIEEIGGDYNTGDGD